ncbi:hypothetical protein [Guptibacillus algicola]|uniref:hypothetical protein n=1 Tax=Guptibacillus algicola TaxID=225844 RepID=UPI001CD4B4C3|nr:hypothetical protein [Alkalihalobacillus algicola]MCA0986232.1 hypothetical protein [Alkalihalobacillus algicola]
MDHKRLSDERGSSLVLVLLVTLIFTVLGLSLLSATVNGTKRTELREDDVQATFVAEKGVDELVQSIQADLRNGLGSSGLQKEDFTRLIDRTVSNYTDPTVLSHDTGESSAKIVNVDTTSNALRRLIEVESVGTVNNETKTVTKTLEIGPDSFPEVLKYAIGAYQLCPKDPSCDVKGEGNLFLHGAVDITGDLLVDGDLVTTNQGVAIYGNKDYWIDTFLPIIKSVEGPPKKAKMVIGGSIYNFTNEPQYKNHIKRMNFNDSKYIEVEAKQAFAGNDYPLIENREPVRDPVDIEERESSFKYELNDRLINGESITYKKFGELEDYPKTVFINGMNMPNDNVYPYYNDDDDDDDEDELEDMKKFKNIVFYNNNLFKRFSADKNVYLTGNAYYHSKTSTKNGMYVGENLYIGNTISNNNQRHKLKVSGTYFVEEDLTILNADIQFNAIIYVKGDVNIQYSVLKGLTENGKEGSLIVFAEGDIHISNNSVYEDTPSNIRGFFYSEGEFEMYGVGSNVHIDGGISARRIVLNAVKGQSRDSNPNNSQFVKYGDGYFQLPSYQQNQPSRLKISYNPDIIKTYSDLKTEEPYIKVVNEPVPIDRTKD